MRATRRYRWDDDTASFRAPTTLGLRLTRLTTASATGTGRWLAQRRRSTATSVDAGAPVDERLERYAELDRRLADPHTRGGFLAMLCDPADAIALEEALPEAYDRDLVSVDALVLDALRECADEKRIDWSVVLEADAPEHPEGRYLRTLVTQAWPAIESRLLGAKRPLVLVHPGLIARFDRPDLIDRLRDAAGTPGGPPGVWVVIPGVGSGRPRRSTACRCRRSIRRSECGFRRGGGQWMRRDPAPSADGGALLAKVSPTEGRGSVLEPRTGARSPSWGHA